MGGETSDVCFAALSAGSCFAVFPILIFFQAATNLDYRLSKIMGLHMDDIHTPTVASGPTSGPGPATAVDTDKLSLMDLINEKTRVEEELSTLGSVLDSVHFSLATSLFMRVGVDSHSARRQHEHNPNHLRRLPQR